MHVTIVATSPLVITVAATDIVPSVKEKTEKIRVFFKKLAARPFRRAPPPPPACAGARPGKRAAPRRRHKLPLLRKICQW